MSTSEIDYKVDHLFLLVGDNPLPNYIAAKMLLKEDGTVYLVHSTETATKADCLKRRLTPINIRTISLANKEADSHFIWDKIKNEVEEIAKKNPEHNFGLNYTGGTKAMSVHSYRGLFDASGVLNPVFSYLDARSLKMLIDRDNDSPKTKLVKEQVKFKELLDLHDLNWKENKKPSNQPVLPDAAKEFLVAYLSVTPKNIDSIATQWSKWCKSKLDTQAKIGKFWKEETELIKISGISLDGAPDKIKQVLQNYKMLNSNGELCLQASKNQGFSSLTDVCAWLSGIWLEHYVLHQIKIMSGQFPDIHESAMSFHIDDPDNNDDRYDRFEFDVAFMRDYQLFALSCTTASDKFTCKQKLFEAHLRAKQLGGDEARVALICLYNNPDQVKGDLEATVKDKKIAVFGRNDLKPNKFAKKMTQWIKDNSPES
ncbi:MAG TPA: DUF1887 domain-containing protein [Cyanobacteria bacterium UBA8803]|nr:DUF1887 domain-containing protein [Cyanobacteria bacterium UBA9273]HBL58322.1 DUF1887 domain-containing protein [Cyanobacteria bacterium UBA8803]